MLAVLPPPGRRSLAASVAAAVVLALVGLCGPAGDDGLDAPRVEARALAAPELAAPAVTDTPAPSQPAGIAEAADALADAPRVDPALERRAADAVAEGRPADAARLHAELAERHPERPVHRAAARILAERAHALAAADSASVDWAGRDSDVR